MASSIPSTNSLHLSLLHRRPPNLFIPSITPLKLPSLSPTFLLKTSSSPHHFHIYPHSHTHLLLPRATHNGNSQTHFNDFFKVPIFEQRQQDQPQQQQQPVKTVLWVLFWTTVSLAVFAFSKDPKASAAAVAATAVVGGDSSIKASNFGVKVASALRKFGWPDEAVVFALATLPVIELRGAIPVGYWMQLDPILLTVLSILGNMVPVPLIILYLKKFATVLAGKNLALSKFVDMLFERAKKKAGPVEEFQWLGLMLFVAVPFPGTGAWTGAIIASVLDMPFWSGVSANFFGVVLAGLLVNLLVNLGLKYAVITGVILFLASTFMWSFLRSLKKTMASSE